MFQPQQAKELGSFDLVFLTLESKIQQKDLQNLSLWLRELVERRHLGGMSLQWRPREVIMGSCESEAWIALETSGCWRCHSCGIPSKESCRLAVEPAREREVFCSQQRQKHSEKWRGLWYQKWRCRDWNSPRFFFSYFGSVFSHYDPFPLFSKGNVILCHCIWEIYDLLFDFDFTRSYDLM